MKKIINYFFKVFSKKSKKARPKSLFKSTMPKKLPYVFVSENSLVVVVLLLIRRYYASKRRSRKVFRDFDKFQKMTIYGTNHNEYEFVKDSNYWYCPLTKHIEFNWDDQLYFEKVIYWPKSYYDKQLTVLTTDALGDEYKMCYEDLDDRRILKFHKIYAKTVYEWNSKHKRLSSMVYLNYKFFYRYPNSYEVLDNSDVHYYFKTMLRSATDLEWERKVEEDKYIKKEKWKPSFNENTFVGAVLGKSYNKYENVSNAINKYPALIPIKEKAPSKDSTIAFFIIVVIPLTIVFTIYRFFIRNCPQTVILLGKIKTKYWTKFKSYFVEVDQSIVSEKLLVPYPKPIPFKTLEEADPNYRAEGYKYNPKLTARLNSNLMHKHVRAREAMEKENLRMWNKYEEFKSSMLNPKYDFELSFLVESFEDIVNNFIKAKNVIYNFIFKLKDYFGKKQDIKDVMLDNKLLLDVKKDISFFSKFKSKLDPILRECSQTRLERLLKRIEHNKKLLRKQKKEELENKIKEQLELKAAQEWEQSWTKKIVYNDFFPEFFSDALVKWGGNILTFSVKTKYVIIELLPFLTSYAFIFYFLFLFLPYLYEILILIFKRRK